MTAADCDGDGPGVAGDEWVCSFLVSPQGLAVSGRLSEITKSGDLGIRAAVVYERRKREHCTTVLIVRDRSWNGRRTKGTARCVRWEPAWIYWLYTDARFNTPSPVLYSLVLSS